MPEKPPPEPDFLDTIIGQAAGWVKGWTKRTIRWGLRTSADLAEVGATRAARKVDSAVRQLKQGHNKEAAHDLHQAATEARAEGAPTEAKALDEKAAAVEQAGTGTSPMKE